MGVRMPNIPNTYYNKPRNFKLVIYAYRKMTKPEILLYADTFRRNMRWQKYPLNASYEVWVTLQ